MNLFTLSENNASEFTFVVSRASAFHDDTEQKVAERIIKEMSVTVLINIDDLPAVELFYYFENDGAQIWQKQSIVLLDDNTGGKKIVCYIGTCPGRFNEYYIKQYQEIIKSIRFNALGCDNEPVPVAADSSEIFF